MRTLLISAMLLLAVTPAAAKEKLFLKNGDTLQGDVTDYSQSVIAITTKYGTLQVPVNDLSGVASDNPTLQDAVEQAMIAQTLNPANPALAAPINVTTATPPQTITEIAVKT
ncbi:MAG: hypothetical protein ACPGRX_07915, partial [Bdellovibrionales bacterium]